MTALDLIREGFGNWLTGFSGTGIPVWIVVILLTPLGYLSAAFVGRRPKGTDSSAKTPLHTALEGAPFSIHIKDQDGTSVFENAMHRNISGFNPQDISNDRIEITGRDTSHWYTLSQVNSAEQMVEYALPADDLVQSENAMKRLMETLSTTFANLSTGLAVFDSDGTLKLFNPALQNILGLDPVWLIMRPDMSTFLEKLRENQHLPEHQNFLEWKNLLTDMKAVAGSDNYSDQWALPNGTVLQVTGHPHSQGAVSFLFTDITAQIMVERQYHTETALNQAVLDNVSDAIVLIDPAGIVRFANTAFDKLFDLESTGTLSEMNLSKLQDIWPQTHKSDAFWSKLRSFISQSGGRAHWTSHLSVSSNLIVNVFPMPDASTLVSFATQNTTTDGGKIVALFQKADAKITDTDENHLMNDPLKLNALKDFLSQRQISLDLSAFSQSHAEDLATIETRRILWYLALTASNTCETGGRISLNSAINGNTIQISCHISDGIIHDNHNHLPLNLLKQLLSQSTGRSSWTFDESENPLRISRKLPNTQSGEVTQFMSGTS